MATAEGGALVNAHNLHTPNGAIMTRLSWPFGCLLTVALFSGTVRGVDSPAVVPTSTPGIGPLLEVSDAVQQHVPGPGPVLVTPIGNGKLRYLPPTDSLGEAAVGPPRLSRRTQSDQFEPPETTPPEILPPGSPPAQTGPPETAPPGTRPPESVLPESVPPESVPPESERIDPAAPLEGPELQAPNSQAPADQAELSGGGDSDSLDLLESGGVVEQSLFFPRANQLFCDMRDLFAETQKLFPGQRSLFGSRSLRSRGDPLLLGGRDFGPWLDSAGAAAARFQLSSRVEGLLLHREQPFSRALILQNNQGAFRTVLDGDGVDLGLAIGPRLALGGVTENGVHWEGLYFGLYNWATNESVTGNGNLLLAGDLGRAGTNNFTNVDFISVDYDSEIHNAEVNVIHHLHGWTSYPDDELVLLTGVRFLVLNEDLQLVGNDTVGDGTPGQYTVKTENYLFGAQVGARGRRRMQRTTLQGSMKFGLFGTSHQQDTLLTDFDQAGNFVTLRDLQFTDQTAAVLFEFDLSAAVAITDEVTLQAGWLGIWIQGVATAANQLDFTDTINASMDLDPDESVWVQGVYLSLERRW